MKFNYIFDAIRCLYLLVLQNISETSNFHILKEHCAILIDHSDEVKQLKRNCPTLIDYKFKVDDIHKIVAALNPRMKSLKMLSKAEQNLIYDLIQQKVIDSHRPPHQLNIRPFLWDFRPSDT